MEPTEKKSKESARLATIQEEEFRVDPEARASRAESTDVRKTAALGLEWVPTGNSSGMGALACQLSDALMRQCVETTLKHGGLSLGGITPTATWFFVLFLRIMGPEIVKLEKDEVLFVGIWKTNRSNGDKYSRILVSCVDGFALLKLHLGRSSKKDSGMTHTAARIKLSSLAEAIKESSWSGPALFEVESMDLQSWSIFWSEFVPSLPQAELPVIRVRYRTKPTPDFIGKLTVDVGYMPEKASTGATGATGSLRNELEPSKTRWINAIDARDYDDEPQATHLDAGGSGLRLRGGAGCAAGATTAEGATGATSDVGAKGWSLPSRKSMAIAGFGLGTVGALAALLSRGRGGENPYAKRRNQARGIPEWRR